MKRFILILMFMFSCSMSVFSVGELDTTFGTGGIVTTDVGSFTADTAYAVALQPDGKSVVVGVAANLIGIVRYNIDGSIDTTFDSDGMAYTDFGTGTEVAYAVAIQNDGKIVLAGTHNNSGNFVVARYNSDGSLDTSFGTGGLATYAVGTTGATAYAIAVQKDGKIVLAGTVDNNVIAVVRINESDGSLDITFNTGGTGGATPNTAGIITTVLGTATTIYDVAIQSDGKIVVAGTSDNKVLVARYLANGSGLDTAVFNSSGTPGYILVDLDGMTTAYAVALQSDDKIVVAGYSYDGSTERLAVARFIEIGLLDSYANNNVSPFGTGGAGFQTGYIFYGFAEFTSAIAQDVVVQSDDKIVVAGTYEDDFIVARFLSDGSAIDTTFDTVGYVITDIGSSSVDVAHAIAMQENNKFIVVGTTDSNAGDFAVVRYNGDAVPQGVLDTTYDSDGFVTYPTDNDSTHKPQVKALQVQADNSVLVVTENLAIDTKSQLVQLAADGTVLTTAIDIAQAGVSDVIMDGTGRVLVVGSNGASGWVARYTITPGTPGTFSLDSTFNSGAILVETANSTQIVKVTENSFGKIIVAAKNGSALLLLSYNSDGSVDTSFGVGGTGYYEVNSNATFHDMLMGPDNGIYVVYKQSSVKISKVNSNGTDLASDFNSGAVVDTIMGTSASGYLALDNNQQLILIIIKSSGNTIVCKRYEVDGTLELTKDFGNPFLTVVPVIKQAQCDTDNKLVFTGYNVDTLFVIRLQADVTDFDPTFAPNAQVPGILKVMYNNNNPTNFINGAAGTTPHRVSNAVGIGGNGNIVFGGYETIDATNTVSFVARVTGDPTPYTQVARYPGCKVGQLDTNFATSGALDLGALDASILNSQSQAVLGLLDGGHYVALTDFYLNRFLETISGFSNPTAIVVRPDQSIMYVANNSSSTISIVDVSDNSIIDTITGLSTSPTSLALDADRNLLYVGNEISANCQIVDLSDNSISAINGLFDWQRGLAFDSVNNLLYVAKFMQNKVDVIDLNTNTIVQTISGLNSAFGIALNEAATVAYVTNVWDNVLYIVSLGETPSITDTISGFSGPNRIALNQDESIAYVSNDGNNTISIVDLNGTPSIIGTITGFNNTLGIGISKNDFKMYVSQGSSNTVLVYTGISNLIKTTSANILDTSYNTTGLADIAPQGVHAMIIDGLGRVVLTGTAGAGNGWVQRYTTSGAADTTFSGDGLISGPMSVATTTIEQTLGRLVVAGKNTNGVLRAYTDSGVLDTTFNSLGSTPGEFSLSANTNAIYALVADEYDRLIIAYMNAAGNAIDLARLTASGELDTTFGTAGVVAGVIASADDATQVRVVLNSAGNIVVAAHINDGADKIAVKSYDNLLASSGNGAVVNAQYNLSGLTGPILTDIIATSDGHVLVLGTQSGTSNMWLARVILSGTSTITLDTAGFNPNAVGGTTGLFQYAGSGTTGHIYNAVAAHADGRLSIVGYENSGGTFTPYLLSVYNDTVVVQEEQFQATEPIGTRDQTFGVTTDSDDRITFFASPGAGEAQEQVARAIALQGYNKLLVACDGQSTIDSGSRVFLNQFTVEGTVDTGFNATGQVEVPHVYTNEHVRDMITFSQNGVNKAILAGYATSGSPLNVTNSWLMQYDLSTYDVDQSFGGKYKDGLGTAFGDIKEFHTVGRQSTGKIIASGLNYDSVGTVVGYTSNGLLDKSFGFDGYYLSASTTGIYTHAIDSVNRVVFAYTNGSGNLVIARLLADGSGLDVTFGTAGVVTTAIAVAQNDQTRISIDLNDKIIVVTQVLTSGDCSITRYTSAGILDIALTLPVATFGDTLTFNIAQLLTDLAGKVIVVGTSLELNNELMMIIRTASDLTALDTTFNTADTPGYIKYNVDSAKTSRESTHAVIHSDGRIIVVGSENGSIS